MTDFYRLPLAERAERLRALATVALARWGVRDCEPEIVKVRENAVFRVAAADGRDAVLRVHRHGYHSDAALRSELAWLEALHTDGIAVPAVIPSAAGEPFEIVQGAGVPEPRQVDMLTWMPGIPIGTLEEGLNPAIADVHAVFAGVGPALRPSPQPDRGVDAARRFHTSRLGPGGTGRPRTALGPVLGDRRARHRGAPPDRACPRQRA